MTDTITVTGVVASDPTYTKTASGVSITRFRLASAQRRFDKATNAWVDGDTNWYNVSGFRRLGDNLAASLKKTDRVIVSGRLRVRDWESGDKHGTAVDIDADTVGHDLFWGTTQFSRVVVSRALEGSAPPTDGAEPSVADEGAWSNAAPREDRQEEEPEASLDASRPLVQHYPVEAPVSS